MAVGMLMKQQQSPSISPAVHARAECHGLFANMSYGTAQSLLTIEGTTGSSITLNVPKGDTIETALNEKQAEIMGQVGEGYTWRGWRTGKDGTGEPFNPQTRITTDVTLYPYYTKDGTFTVEYVSGKE